MHLQSKVLTFKSSCAPFTFYLPSLPPASAYRPLLLPLLLLPPSPLPPHLRKGPLLDATGLWHTWEDDGAWSHWTSKDLIHWSGSFRENTTHFGGDTGSVSPTPSGVYAFWPGENAHRSTFLAVFEGTDGARCPPPPPPPRTRGGEWLKHPINVRSRRNQFFIRFSYYTFETLGLSC